LEFLERADIAPHKWNATILTLVEQGHIVRLVAERSMLTARMLAISA
jgi:hypothetical protein